jgi:epoxyqueuosine reductase
MPKAINKQNNNPLSQRIDKLTKRVFRYNKYPDYIIICLNIKVPALLMDTRSFTIALKEEARRLGFDLVGATPAVRPPDIEHFERWLAAGLAGEMRYLAERLEAYRDPGRILPGAKSILMLGVNYRTDDPATAGAGQGRVSRYAWGNDYHDVIHKQLEKLAEFHRRLVPHCLVRGVVDTAPLLERGFAQQAGLGWIGKNTLLINQHYGSWLFLAALLTTAQLNYDEPTRTNHCGSCRACLDACPTGALVAPNLLDARKCISYLTIESRSEFPSVLREACGDWLFGCDACQEVCPWNRRAPKSREKSYEPRPGMNPVDLAGLFALDEAAFRSRFRDTPLWRAKLARLLRNAAVALGIQTDENALQALEQGLLNPDPVVQEACNWAVKKISHQRDSN